MSFPSPSSLSPLRCNSPRAEFLFYSPRLLGFPQGDVIASLQSIRACGKALHTGLHTAVHLLLKGKDTRGAMLDWLQHAINSNAERGKMQLDLKVNANAASIPLALSLYPSTSLLLFTLVPLFPLHQSVASVSPPLSCALCSLLFFRVNPLRPPSGGCLAQLLLQPQRCPPQALRALPGPVKRKGMAATRYKLHHCWWDPRGLLGGHKAWGLG